MAQTLKRIDAGGIQVAALYPRRNAKDVPRSRQAKFQASSAAQRRMNQINSVQQLELRLAANFPTAGSGLVVTLTHDDDHMPKNRRGAQLHFKYFLEKLRQARRRADLPEPVVFWAPEILTSESGRWHHHIALDNTGQDYEIIRDCWIYGSDVEIRKLRVDAEKNHETLAMYMTKELRECQEYEAKAGLHGWSCTRNAKKPEVETIIVPDDFELVPPEGSTVLLDEKRTTEWASYRIIKYRFDGKRLTPVPRARRRRRR